MCVPGARGTPRQTQVFSAGSAKCCRQRCCGQHRPRCDRMRV